MNEFAKMEIWVPGTLNLSLGKKQRQQTGLAHPLAYAWAKTFSVSEACFYKAHIFFLIFTFTVKYILFM